MTTIKLNRKNHTIEITKAFNTKASKYGTDEYNMLIKACNENPGFRVVVIKRKGSSANKAKGLTYEYMERYIQTHDDEKNSIMLEYFRRRGNQEMNIEALAKSDSYEEIKNWFFKQYPAIASAYGIN